MDKTQIDYMMGTATFYINMEANSSKQTLKGTFKVKCVLSPLEYINSDSMYRELLGKTNPQYASDYVNQLCYALSQLKYRVVSCPAWFKNIETGIDGSSIDDNILLYILDKCVEAEADYRKGIEERYDKAREAVRKAIDDGSLNDGEEKQKEEEEEMEDDLEE
jgi:hypothetical protein